MGANQSKLKNMGANQSKPGKPGKPGKPKNFNSEPLTKNQVRQTTSRYYHEVLRDYREALDIFNSIISHLNKLNTVILEASENPELSPKDQKFLKKSVAALLKQKAKLLRIHDNLLKSCADEASKIYAACEYALSIARQDRMVYRANSYVISDKDNAECVRGVRMENLNEKLITENKYLVDQHIDLEKQYIEIWRTYNIVL